MDNEELEIKEDFEEEKQEKKPKKNKSKIIIICMIILLVIASVLLFLLVFKKDEFKGFVEKKVVKKKEENIKIVDLKSNTRPYAVMINNNQAVWGYQAGLQDAYITYEMIVEGGITRLMAIFKDQTTTRISSVRSSRHYFLDYALENDAIYAHIGWSPQAQTDISKLGINIVSGDNSKAFIWDNSLRQIATEHRAYTSIDMLKEASEKRGYRLTSDSKLLLTYQEKPIDFSKYETDVPNTKVTIPYSQGHVVSYEYDAENKVYKRFQNGKEHIDYITGKQYTYKNIIAYNVENYPLNDGSGKDRQGLNNIGSGEGYYITDGVAIPITWEKKLREEKTVYKYKETGKELIVNDGNTFIQIYPKSKTIELQ